MLVQSFSIDHRSPGGKSRLWAVYGPAGNGHAFVQAGAGPSNRIPLPFRAPFMPLRSLASPAPTTAGSTRSDDTELVEQPIHGLHGQAERIHIAPWFSRFETDSISSARRVRPAAPAIRGRTRQSARAGHGCCRIKPWRSFRPM